MAENEWEMLPFTREIEQPEDAIALFSDYPILLDSSTEAILQFYETIPAEPNEQGRIVIMTSKLRATIRLSYITLAGLHENIGKLLKARIERQQ